MDFPPHADDEQPTENLVSEGQANAEPCEGRLAGEQVLFVGKLTGMTRQEACALVREHGGRVASGVVAGGEVAGSEAVESTLIVIGDNQPDMASALPAGEQTHQQLSAAIASGRAELVRESALWQRLGLIDDEHAEHHEVQRLYTPSMLAELLGLPVAAIRRWHRQGYLVACRSVRRLPYFDFAEVAVARHLAALFNEGCSLAVIDRKLTELHRSMPDVARPLCDPAVVVSGRQLILRRGDDLAEPGGQLLMDFDNTAAIEEESEVVLSVADGVRPINTTSDDESEPILSAFDQMLFEALKLEDQGELQQAAEVYRTLLMAREPTAELHFALADLLYRMGDLAAARERFYVAIELDEEYVEARASLGCVLAENGELDLAIAAFQGALAYHADYADVHYHLANALDRMESHSEAASHWRTFLSLAPESPWAEAARTRLADSAEQPGLVLVP